MTQPRVLVVDDKPNNLKLFAEILSADHHVSVTDSGARALAMVELGDFEVLLSDIRMPGMDGFTLLREVKRLRPQIEVILMTAFGSVPRAVAAMKEGAYSYLTKPVDPDELLVVVAQAVERRRLKDQAAGVMGGTSRFGQLIGQSPAMAKLFHLMRRAAKSKVTVLIQGESGTGKELVARGIHEYSARSSRPFVPINCGAIPEQLLESELFGHERGAFTGAQASKRGLFEEAEGGTLFLDEVAELPLPLQVKLNRVLQEHASRRIGGFDERDLNVRVISACNVDLEAAVRDGTFREDLFYRLNVFPIVTPPLRDRTEDIPLLVSTFLERQGSKETMGFTTEALDELMRRPWRGNVRELENAVARSVAVCESTRIGLDDLPSRAMGGASAAGETTNVPTALPFRDAVDLVRDRASRQYLTQLMQEFSGNVTKAAERAGVERESLHRLLKKHGIRPGDFR